MEQTHAAKMADIREEKNLLKIIQRAIPPPQIQAMILIWER